MSCKAMLAVFFALLLCEEVPCAAEITNVKHWIPECHVYYGLDDRYHIWDGYHDYRIDSMIHDLDVCDCLTPDR